MNTVQIRSKYLHRLLRFIHSWIHIPDGISVLGCGIVDGEDRRGAGWERQTVT
jgi:hypothetical protein